MRKMDVGRKKGPMMVKPGGSVGDFPEWVHAHENALRNYCRSLAGSVWEGDDLAQDTWLKVWSAARSKGEGFRLTRAYLYRTARNAWIDRGRKKILLTQPTLVDDLPQPQIDSVTLWTAMETLVGQLAPIQRTALLLIDILQYTAAEAAELVDSTEGAVKAALHRARVKLRNILKQPELKGRRNSRSDGDVPNRPEDTPGLNEAVVYAYLEAFRRQDATALAMLLNEPHPHELVPVLTLQSYRRNNAQSKPGKLTSEPVQSHMLTMHWAA